MIRHFYLDIIKDRLYSSKKDSIERRAAQTTMYEILNTLVKILAPILCYTAEEIWKYMPHTKNEQVESVMLTYFPEVNEQYDNKELTEKWNKILELKELVSKNLELARADKIIGHSLNAKITLYANDKDYEFIKNNLEILKTVFIVSDLQVEENLRKEKEKIQEHYLHEKHQKKWDDKYQPVVSIAGFFVTLRIRNRLFLYLYSAV